MSKGIFTLFPLEVREAAMFMWRFLVLGLIIFHIGISYIHGDDLVFIMQQLRR